MKIRILLLLIGLITLHGIAFGQNTCPPNIDFENGDFANWECFTGTTSVGGTKNIISLTPSAPVAGRHEIISSPTNKDKYGGFPELCPYGGKYSVKLGNDASGSLAEGISYTFTVPANIDTFTFTYFYAVVFENPGHFIYEQPRFFVSAYDVVTGAVINCASFDYVSTGSLPGFNVSSVNSSVLYKDWTPASLQFAGLNGKQVRLEFKTADCTLGGHFGYGYLDVASGCSNILATAPYCIETNSLLLNAPYGFQSYTWYNNDYSAIVGNTQSITISPAPSNSSLFHVDAIPYTGYGCRDTFNAVVKPLTVPDTPFAKDEYKYCLNDIATPLTATGVNGNEILWYTSATGGTPSIKSITPITTTAGTFTYYVTQKVLFGCESFRKKITVTILPTPSVTYTVNKLRQCQNNNEFIFTSTVGSKYKSEHLWDFGDGNTLVTSADTIVKHIYSISGTLKVNLKVTNDSTCIAEKATTITLVPKPIVNFTYPPIICQNQTLLTLTDNSTVANNIAVINKWWWNIDGLIVPTQTPTPFIPANGGIINATLVVTTQEGCTSDTMTALIDIRHQPVAAYNYGTIIPLCENETIKFTNASTIPNGGPTELQVKWYWNFDNITYLSIQHPALNLTAGTHSGKLITESNYGCKSKEIDSIFIVNPKPHIVLDINDSCVYRYINYKAVDLTGNVADWFWDFGNGFFNGDKLFSKIYYQAGNHPLRLLGRSKYGCKDTIVRPFQIYENKASAGRDTIAAKGEPVHLNAHGVPGQIYVWSPPTGLDSTNIETPTATLDVEQLYRLYSVTKEGCDNNTKILIKRYKGPDLYIASGFTPNKDGLNDVLKVFPVGFKTFHYFAVYNRWGELLFYTNDHTKGWDGTYKGKLAESGVYVVYAEALDYKNQLMTKRDTVTLLR
ncbi:MAG: PKD domain-containing protein [Flavobacterium sp.]|nr:PKD domain-containing protein [Flavobacterium sp.]